MDNTSTEIESKRKHSKLGLVSVLIGVINIVILIYYIQLFILWLMTNQEILKNPSAISGMPVPESVMKMIGFFLIMQVVGLFTGIFGLIEKNKRKLLPIIGIILNGLFLLVTASKLI